jgi:UDP-GlcNAc:undecaprenyl-phosphate/decaprenyl-phosphate GlcNAc-1-phosphate transferase
MFDLQIFLPIIVCGALSLALCLNSTRIATRFNLLDIPDERKKHSKATPLMGGVVLAASFLPIAFITAITSASERWLGSLLIWLVSMTIMAFIGLADDRHTLSPRARLGLSFLVFGTAAAIDPTFNVRLLDFEAIHFSIGLGTWWIAIIFTVICCVGLVNAVNMADGKNGLVIGLCIGWVTILAFRAPDPLLPYIFLLLTMLVILLVFNLMGLIFLGDGGAYGLACGIGLLAIMIYNSPGNHSLRAISADEVMALFAIPVIDSFRLTYVRMRQGRSPMSPDRNHLHHHLQEKFGWPLGLAVYLSISFAVALAYLNISQV